MALGWQCADAIAHVPFMDYLVFSLSPNSIGDIHWYQPGYLLALQSAAMGSGGAALIPVQNMGVSPRRIATSGLIVACCGLALGGLGFLALLAIAGVIVLSTRVKRARPDGTMPSAIDTGVALLPAEPPRTNRWAIATALVASLTGPLGFVAIPMGLGALGNLRKTGEAGRAWAIAGIIVGCVWLVIDFFLVIFLIALSGDWMVF